MTATKSMNTTTMKKDSYRIHSSRKGSLIYQMYTKLNFMSKPLRIIPHGLSGVILLIVGYYLTFCSISGNLFPYGIGRDGETTTSLLTVTFYISGIMNAVGGYMMAPKAPKGSIHIFRTGSVLQVSMIYWSIRFFPSTFYNFGSNSSSVGSLVWALYRFCDVLFLFLLIGGIFAFVFFVCVNERRPTLLIAAIFAASALGTVAIYPAQSVYDPNWFLCTLEKYPLQGLAGAAYVYIPVTTIFSTLAFMATLLTRKMISDLQMAYAILFLVGVVSILLVFTTEWFLADLTTQILYLPCTTYTDENVTSSGPSWDISSIVRTVIHAAGYELPTSPYSFYTPPK
jgi:hypothetical protein